MQLVLVKSEEIRVKSGRKKKVRSEGRMYRNIGF
jgi:hypothetical protein